MVRVLMRSYFSTHHLWAAKHFAEKGALIEAEHSGKPNFDIKHRAYVISAVVEAGAFLESAINELFKDCLDGHSSYIASLSEASINDLKKQWNEWHSGSRARISTLDKYDAALSCVGTNRFARGRDPYQTVELLMRLRNFLIHYTPESIARDDPHKLGDALKSRFKENALMEDSRNAYFPDKCLGAGCARWAVDGAIDFADAFFGKLCIAPNYRVSDFFAGAQ